MHHFIRRTALAALMLAALPAANAAIQTYNFNGTLDSGAYAGQTFGGNFSFDDAGLTGINDEWLAVTQLSFNFLNHNYNLASAAVPTEVAYFNGNFLGLSYTVDSGDPKFSFVAGYDSLSQAFVAYDTVAGLSGAGSVTFALAPVPEPESYAMLLAGLGMLGLASRRRYTR